MTNLDIQLTLEDKDMGLVIPIPDKAWYEARLKNVTVEVLTEIVTTSQMTEETRNVFKVMVAEGEGDLLRERLAGWLAEFAKEKFNK